MSETMIEKLARELASTHFRDDKIWDDMDENTRLWYANAVRVVLQAAFMEPGHDLRLAVARSIGRTVGIENHMVRAEDVIKTIASHVLTEKGGAA